MTSGNSVGSVDEWSAAMGGGTGDGIVGGGGGSSSNSETQQQAHLSSPTPPSVVHAYYTGTPTQPQATTAASQPPQQQQQQQQQHQSVGSITRFATPPQQQQQPQSYGYSPQQQQQQQPQSYTVRSQQQQQQQQPQPVSSYSNTYYGSQQQQQQQPVYGGSSSAMAGANPSGSYAARSQQPLPPPGVANVVYTGGPAPQQRNVYGGGPQQQQQQPPAGSYAARSAAVLYGSQQPTITTSAPLPPPAGNFYGSAAPTQQQQQMQRAYSGDGGGVMPQPQQLQPGGVASPVTTTTTPSSVGASMAPAAPVGTESTHHQQRLLTEATRKVQEHSYYMKQAMEQNSLAVVLDRAAHMVGELGGPPHGQTPGGVGGSGATPGSSGGGGSSGGPVNTGGSAKLNPKNYYELYMRALEDMPAVEEYLFNLAELCKKHPSDQQQPQQLPSNIIRIVDTASQLSNVAQPRPSYTMRQLYDCVQYCPRVVSRLYLQIAAGSALIRSGECGAKWVMNDLQEAVKCEQNPVRGLFLRYFLLTALRDKLPDVPPPHPGAPSANLATIPSEEELEEGDDKDGDDDSAAKFNNDLYTNRKTVDEHDKGTVKDSYEFVLANFMEMNKLWVRIQHLPGEGKNKDVRKRRERERNDLRILVGTNLVRLSQLECVTSKIYGEAILPHILEHIVTTGDPLSQAYLMDCLVQVFPDEYHIETLPILLNVCPRLRDKVNIRTILQGLMDRLANYLAEEELLDESDTNQVKKALARDSFGLFEECVQKVYNARGPKLTSKEVIRLQTALLQFSIKCYPGNMEQVSHCINSCVSALRQANTSYEAFQEGTVAMNVPAPAMKSLDDASVVELEKLLSIPLDSLALRALELEQYSGLIGFLPWANRREVAMTMLKAVENAGSTPKNVEDIERLFNVIEPLVRDEHTTTNNPTVAGLTGQVNYNQLSPSYSNTEPVRQYIDPVQFKKIQQENSHVAKLVHLLNHDDTDTVFEMLQVAKNHITQVGSGPNRIGQTLVAVVFAALRLASRVFDADQGVSDINIDSNATKEDATNDLSAREDAKDEENSSITGVPEETRKQTSQPKAISCRQIFVFVQETIATVAKYSAEKGLKLYLDASLTADRFATIAKADENGTDYAPISYELLTRAFVLYEEQISEGNAQYRCITCLSGALLAVRSISTEEYESLITKTAQFSAKVVKKPDQCHLVALCAHLFYPIGSDRKMNYSNPQRALECLQRSLKLADACTSTNPAHVNLFVDLLEHYVYFFEKKNPLITHAYVTGLVALLKEHLSTLNALGSDGEAKAQFLEVVRYIKERKADAESAELFSNVQIGM